MKKGFLLLFFVIILIPLFSVDSHLLPLYSQSYYGREYDFFANPASLSLIERNHGSFIISLNANDDYDWVWKSPMGFINNQVWYVDATFLTNNIALTAQLGSRSERVKENIFNSYSEIALEIDLSYAFPFISFGARIEAGNSLIRRERENNNIFDLMTNAWFSPFSEGSVNGFFNLGAGIIFYYSPLSIGVYTGKIITINDGGNLYIGWEAISESTTLSVSLGMPRHNKSGDLFLLRPRASISITGLVDDSTRYIDYQAELTVQFLPRSDLTFAFSYLEQSHAWFKYVPSNAVVSFSVRGGMDNFYGEISFRFKADDWSVFSPSLSFTYSK